MRPAVANTRVTSRQLILIAWRVRIDNIAKCPVKKGTSGFCGSQCLVTHNETISIPCTTYWGASWPMHCAAPVTETPRAEETFSSEQVVA